jgi:hypothetical protein
MKRFLPALLLSLLASTAFAQTAATPPEQAPAGNPGKLTLKKSTTATTPAATDAAAATTPTTKDEKRSARKAKRSAKVGDKPIN